MAEKKPFSIADAIKLTQDVYKKAIAPVLLGTIQDYQNVGYRKSGCLALDWLLANHSKKGGLPRGRFIMFYGPEGCGKTTLASVCCISMQRYKSRNISAYSDFENKYNPEYAIAMGLDPFKMYFCQPSGDNAGESGLEQVANNILAEEIGCQVVDSIMAVSSKEEINGELTDANVGANARLWSKGIKKANRHMTPESGTVILINGLRAAIGDMFKNETLPGARAIKYACACIIDIRVISKIKDDDTDEVIGQTVKLKAVKNQVGQPFLEETIDVIFGEGYDNVRWCLDKADDLEIIKKGRGKVLTPSGKVESNVARYEWYDGNIISESEAIKMLGSDENELNELYSRCVDQHLANRQAALEKRAALKEETGSSRRTRPKGDGDL